MKRKKKILIYADKPSWAYDNIGKAVAADLSEVADFYFDYCCCHLYYLDKESFHLRFKRDVHRTIKNLMSFFGTENKFDWNYRLIGHKFLPFWIKKFTFNSIKYERRVLPPWRSYDVILYFDFYFDRYACLNKNGKRIIKGIYTDSFPPECLELDYKTLRRGKQIDFNINKQSFFRKYFEGVDLIACGSNNLIKEFDTIPKNKLFLNYLRDENKFFPKNKDYLKTLVVGWTGNPNREFKNYYSLVVPAVEYLNHEGLDIKLKSRFEGPFDTLPQFYDDVHLIIIASVADSGPSMFAEASLSGIPAISTKVGFANFVISDGVDGFFIEPTLIDIIEMLRNLYFDRESLIRASRLIRNSYLQKMGNSILLKNWIKAFELECVE